MFARAPRRARLRAHVVPAAYSEVMRALGRRVADVLSTADNALSAVGNRFKPRRG